MKQLAFKFIKNDDDTLTLKRAQYLRGLRDKLIRGYGTMFTAQREWALKLKYATHATHPITGLPRMLLTEAGHERLRKK